MRDDLNHLYSMCTGGRKIKCSFCWSVTDLPLHRDHATVFVLVIRQVNWRLVHVALSGLLLCLYKYKMCSLWCVLWLLNYCISNEIKTSWVLCDNIFLKKKKVKNIYIAV